MLRLTSPLGHFLADQPKAKVFMADIFDRDGESGSVYVLCLWHTPQFNGHKYAARERLGKFKGQTDLPAKEPTPKL